MEAGFTKFDGATDQLLIICIGTVVCFLAVAVPFKRKTLFNSMSALFDLNDRAEDDLFYEQMRHRLEARGIATDADLDNIAHEPPAETVGRLAEDPDEIIL